MSRLRERLGEIRAKVGRKEIPIEDFEQIKCPVCGKNMTLESFDFDSGIGQVFVVLKCENLCVEKMIVNANKYTPF